MWTLLTTSPCLREAAREWSNKSTGHGKTPLAKGQGKGMNVSEWLTLNGRLCISKNVDISEVPHYKSTPGCLNEPKHACECMIPSKEAGWWNGERMLAQTIDCALPIFNHLYPGKKGVFLLDNSLCHTCYPKDGLRAVNLIAKDGGKNTPAMRDGWFMQDRVRKEQKMTVCDDNNKPITDESGKHIARGLVSLLSERGLLVRKTNLTTGKETHHIVIDGVAEEKKDLVVCKLCSIIKESYDSSGVAKGFFRDSTHGLFCCMRRIMAYHQILWLRKLQLWKLSKLLVTLL